MPVDHRERTFEAAIERSLLTVGGYTSADPASFDHGRCLDHGPLLAFVQATQPTTWGQIAAFYGPRAETALLDDLTRALDGRGSLDVLRHGFKCLGKLIVIASFKPATTMNPEAAARYAANRLTVTRSCGTAQERQLARPGAERQRHPGRHRRAEEPADRPDRRATPCRQYRHDRDPREPLFQFKRRALVHFAVDPDEVV